MDLDAEQLLTFLVVADSGSLSAAARILHRGQPAISERLQNLAERVGEPLYVREGRGIRLTQAGFALVPSARRVKDALDEAAHSVLYRQRLQEGILRVAATNTLANYFLPTRLGLFAEQHPGIRIHLKGGITDWTTINTNDWDLFFLEGAEDIPRLPSYYQTVPWLQDEIVCVAPPNHNLLTKTPIDWSDLLRVPIIWREPGSGIRRTVEAVFAAQGLHPQFIMEVTGVEAVGAAVAAGLGVGFMTRVVLTQRAHWAVEVLTLRDPEILQWTPYVAAPQPAYQSQAVKAFLALVLTGA